MPVIDPLKLACDLINCPSVTPVDEGAIDVLVDVLEPLGFRCHKLQFGEVTNLYARFGTLAPNFCFAGHTDVVPPGDLNLWSVPPFNATVIEGKLIGRGVVDMKAAIACFVASVSQFIEQHKNEINGSISLLITGDEEGPAVNGTIKVLDWLKAKNETLDACIVGEPTSVATLGDMVKIGRRGSVNFDLTVHGTQGHVAYPHLAENPITKLVSILHKLKTHILDQGNEFFDPSNLEIVNVMVDNKAYNVIPASAAAGINIRFNNLHAAASLKTWIESVCHEVTSNFTLEMHQSADPFITPQGQLSTIVGEAVTEVTGLVPVFSTTGGTSDARFIKDFCHVVELGLLNVTAHKINEQAAVAEIKTLKAIYQRILEKYFIIR